MNKGEIMKARLEVDILKLKNNLKKLFYEYQNYNYKLIDLRNNVYGLGIYLVNIFAEAGFNYGLTTSLNEAIKVRRYNANFPLLIKEKVEGDAIFDAINNNITLTIDDLNYLQDLSILKLKDDLKLHILIDNGSNMTGLKSREELGRAIELINSNKHLILEGIYTEFMTYGLDDPYYYISYNNFQNIVNPIKNNDLMIYANEPLMYQNNATIFNGLKFDLAVLGLTQSFNNAHRSQIRKIDKLYPEREFHYLNCDLELVFSLVAFITNISFALKGELIGRNYLAKENKRIGIINLGHKDGITKAIKVAVVNNEIVEVLTDMLDEMILGISDNVKIGDKVYLISEFNNITNVLYNLKTNRYYLMSILNNSLPRIYIDGEDEEEVVY